MTRKQKVILIFLFISALLTILLPILAYCLNFGWSIKNISGKNADWAAFGSFLGGIYSSIFSFSSVVVLSVTLYLTQKNNKEQIKLIKQEGTIKDFNQLLDELVIKFSSQKKYTLRNMNEENFIYRLDTNISSDINLYPHLNFEQLVEKQIEVNTAGLYDAEANLMIRLDSTISMLPENLHDTYKALFNSKISNDRRFLLKNYMKVFGFDLKNTIMDNSDFCDFPENVKWLKMRYDAPY
ncbi:hypothetical protein [Serratia grimesii]|uniref:hypothetical protein n=1 Tax=Serratia grimesii TaxID=82995 RepID=UPI0039AEE869